MRMNDTGGSFFSLFRNQQSEYLGALWADVLAVCLVVWSPPARRSLSWIHSTVDWCMAPRKWGFDLKYNSTNYPDHGHHGDPRPHMENPHGRAGNRTRDLVISSQKLWPLDHEAGQPSIWHSCFAWNVERLQMLCIFLIYVIYIFCWKLNLFAALSSLWRLLGCSKAKIVFPFHV